MEIVFYIIWIIISIVLCFFASKWTYKLGHETGYMEGERHGYNIGLSSGEKQGYKSGSDDGYKLGREQGLREQKQEEGSYYGKSIVLDRGDVLKFFHTTEIEEYLLPDGAVASIKRTFMQDAPVDIVRNIIAQNFFQLIERRGRNGSIILELVIEVVKPKER